MSPPLVCGFRQREIQLPRISENIIIKMPGINRPLVVSTNVKSSTFPELKILFNSDKIRHVYGKHFGLVKMKKS